MVVKSIVLLLWIVTPDGAKYWAPSTYYDTGAECIKKVSTMKQSIDASGNKWGYLCAQVVPPVECEYGTPECR